MLDFARSFLSPKPDAPDADAAVPDEGPQASKGDAEGRPAPITSEEVEHLADLARLDLSDDERDALTDDLRRLIDYAEQLSEVDTAGVEPMPPGAPGVPEASAERLRADDPDRPLSQSEALENAPDGDEKGFFRTPSAIEQ